MLLLQEFVLALVGPALDDRGRALFADALQRIELFGRRGIDVEKFDLGGRSGRRRARAGVAFVAGCVTAGLAAGRGLRRLRESKARRNEARRSKQQGKGWSVAWGHSS